MLLFLLKCMLHKHTHGHQLLQASKCNSAPNAFFSFEDTSLTYHTLLCSQKMMSKLIWKKVFSFDFTHKVICWPSLLSFCLISFELSLYSHMPCASSLCVTLCAGYTHVCSLVKWPHTHKSVHTLMSHMPLQEIPSLHDRITIMLSPLLVMIPSNFPLQSLFLASRNSAWGKLWNAFIMKDIAQQIPCSCSRWFWELPASWAWPCTCIVLWPCYWCTCTGGLTLSVVH